jgi:CRISPR/Cas system-associated exonuclease Cas4 (RecB family)
MRNTEFISGLARHIKETYDLKREELTVIFPNKRAAFYLRSKFKEIYHGEEIWLPQMLSIEEAMTQWSEIQLVDNIDMLFELISINAELSHSGSDISIFGSMAMQMAKDFDEIDQYHVDANHLFSYIYEMKRLGTWDLEHGITQKEEQYLRFFEGLKDYYFKLRQRLESQQKGYYGLITRYLSDLSDEELLSKINHRKVIFAGFNALTPTEQKIIDKLYKNQCAEVIWDFDRYYIEDEHNEAGLFARRYIEENKLWKPNVFSDRLLSEAKEIHFISVNGNTIQSKALQSLLQVEHEENVAVILADENLMIPVLNSTPDDPRYSSLMVSMGYPLRQTTLNDFISAFFTLRRKGRKVRDEGWYIWPILRIFDLELIKVMFSGQEINELDAYKSFIAERSIFIFKEEDFINYCQSEDLRQFMKLLLEAPIGMLLSFIANKIQQSNDGNSAMLFLLNQISETGKILNRLKDIMERNHRDINDLREWEILYRLVSSNANIKLNSSTTNGTQLMGLLEARNIDFDTFYMVGVNEGVLPAEKSQSSFIPYQIRKEYKLPDYQEKQAVYAYHFYRLLQGARRMYFIYNAVGAESGGEPSRFLLQLKYELAKRNPKINLVEEVFVNKTEKQHSPETLSASKSTNIPHVLAPTSLSAFIQCPLRFYFKYIMGIKDNSAEEETQNNVIGSIVHDTLEQLYIGYCNSLIDKKLFDKAIKPSLDQNLQKIINKNFKQGLPNVGYNYLNKLTIDKLLANFIRYEEKQVTNHELHIVNVEYKLTTTLKINGLDFTIEGRADRIDKCDGIVRIIDYKTGLLNERDVKVPSQIEKISDIPEKAMQLLIYKYLYLKEHPEVKPEMVTAALFGLKNQKVCFDLKVEHCELNEDFIQTMESILTEVITSMLDDSTPFTQPKDTNVKPCHFCDFKGICSNTATGSQLAGDR